MTTTSARLCRWTRAFGAALVLLVARPNGAHAISLDAEGDMRLGLRAYTAVRLGNEEIGDQNEYAWPKSESWALRQHRSFIQLDFSHDVLGYATSGYGAVRGIFGLIDPDVLSYTLQYRGEFEGIYDYGPSEYQNVERQYNQFRRDVPDLPPLLDPRLERGFIDQRVNRLPRIARDRHRLFLAYLDFEKGPFYMRVGRQIIAWGETDVFRLLDNINPLDDSFGGFFIPLDERRVPLDMVRASWNFGSVLHAFSDVIFEGFVASGKRVAQDPGIPEGSPWVPGGLANPNPALKRALDLPEDTDVRGGVRLSFNFSDITFTLAHYYTYFDIPGVRFTLPGCKPRPAGGAPCGLGGNTAGFGNEIIATQEFPRVPVSGLALTFPVPSWYTIMRSEFAYFQDEPMNRQGAGDTTLITQPLGSPGARRLRSNLEGGLDPFVYPAFLDLTRRNAVHGRLLQRDTFNMSIGADINRYIRFLNPHQSFFISTQFFYKHVFDSPGDLVLPVLHRNIGVDPSTPILGNSCVGKNGNSRACRTRPRFFALHDDRFLHTLLITTTYAGGRLVPSFGMFYDWQGAFVFQPGVTFIYDPFRIVVDYTDVSAAPTGQFGAVRDRDNIRFQVEFVF